MKNIRNQTPELPQNKNLTQISLSKSGQEKTRSQGQKPCQTGKPPEKTDSPPYLLHGCGQKTSFSPKF
jgi:hypothetical protein